MKIDLANINKRSLFLVIFLIMTLIGVWFFKKVYKPNRSKARNLKFKLQNIQDDIRISQTEIPNLEEVTEMLKKNRKTKAELESHYQKYEESVPSDADIDVFLKYLTDFEKEKDFDFVSIKPIASQESKNDAEKKSSSYIRKEFAIKVKGQLQTILSYIFHIKNVSSTAIIDKASIVMMELDDKRYLQSSISLRVLFADKKSKDKVYQPGSNEEFKATLKSNSFMRSLYVKEEDSEEASQEIAKVKIDGILKMGDKARVIYDKNIYKIGDTIQNLKIVDIKNNQVILSGSQGEIIVNVEE